MDSKKPGGSKKKRRTTTETAVAAVPGSEKQETGRSRGDPGSRKSMVAACLQVEREKTPLRADVQRIIDETNERVVKFAQREYESMVSKVQKTQRTRKVQAKAVAKANRHRRRRCRRVKKTMLQGGGV